MSSFIIGMRCVSCSNFKQNKYEKYHWNNVNENITRNVSSSSKYHSMEKTKWLCSKFNSNLKRRFDWIARFPIDERCFCEEKQKQFLLWNNRRRTNIKYFSIKTHLFIELRFCSSTNIWEFNGILPIFHHSSRLFVWLIFSHFEMEFERSTNIISNHSFFIIKVRISFLHGRNPSNNQSPVQIFEKKDQWQTLIVFNNPDNSFEEILNSDSALF